MNKTVIALGPDEDEVLKALVEGKSMTCEYLKGEFDTNLTDSLILGIENCEGELKEILVDLLLFA